MNSTQLLNFAAALMIACLVGGPRAARAEQEGIPLTKQETVEGETHTSGYEETREPRFLHPTNWGEPGTFRVRSAESFPAGTIAFGIGGEFYSVRNAPIANGRADTLAESLFVGWAPDDQLTVSVARKGSSTTFGSPSQLVSSLGDFNFSGMYSFELNEYMHLAPIVNILVASNFNSLTPSGTTISVGAGLAYTLGLDWLAGLPLYVHANLLYHMPQIRDPGPAGFTTQNFFDFSRYNTLYAGLAAELQLGDFIPFLEFNQTVQMGSPIGYGSSPSQIGLGARFTPLSNKSFSFLVGADVGLGKPNSFGGIPFTSDYQIFAQLSYTVGVSQTERKHYYTTQDVGVVDRKFVIRKNIRFEVNSATLTQDSKPLLNEIAEVIRRNNVRKLLIVGHTDSTHTEGYNLALSEKRAAAVKTYLVTQGVEADVLQVKGMGKRKPRASNLTESGRSKNRRVEFFILE
ncbi:MAG: OmpA family protein [Bdellovibrionales bacterium]|nr:OmpA family protein [Bdellovibrionales bacterium]